MRAYVINSCERSVISEKLRSPIRSFSTQFVEPHRISRLPNGDELWADNDRIHRLGSSVASGELVIGTGILVGKKDKGGDYTSPRSDVETVRRLIEFDELQARGGDHA